MLDEDKKLSKLKIQLNETDKELQKDHQLSLMRWIIKSAEFTRYHTTRSCPRSVQFAFMAVRNKDPKISTIMQVFSGKNQLENLKKDEFQLGET